MAKKSVEQLIDDAESVKMQDVTPAVEEVKSDIPSGSAEPVTETPKKRGFTFDEVLSDSNAEIPADGTQMPPKVENTLKTPTKASGTAGFKAIGRLFEKVLEEVCKYKHGVDLETIGANINDKDLNLASEMYGEGAEKGELPKIPNWVALIAFIALIFAFPTYKVLTYTPARPKRSTPQFLTDEHVQHVSDISSDINAPWGINPRTKQPYKRPPYEKKKGGKKK